MAARHVPLRQKEPDDILVEAQDGLVVVWRRFFRWAWRFARIVRTRSEAEIAPNALCLFEILLEEREPSVASFVEYVRGARTTRSIGSMAPQPRIAI